MNEQKQAINERTVTETGMKLYPLACCAAATVIGCGIMLLASSGTLTLVAHQTPWEATEAFLRQFTSTPGGLLGYVASTLAQTFAYPLLGCAILAGIMMTIAHFVSRTFRVPSVFGLLYAVPLIAIVGVYTCISAPSCMPSQCTYFLTSSLGFLGTMGASYILSLMPNATARRIWMAMWTLAALPICGFYAFVGTFYMTVLSLVFPCTQRKQRDRLMTTFASAVIIILTPLVWMPMYDGIAYADMFGFMLPPAMTAGEATPSEVSALTALLASPIMLTIFAERDISEVKLHHFIIGNIIGAIMLLLWLTAIIA